MTLDRLLPIAPVESTACSTTELIRRPIGEDDAARIVPVLKALADPVRLRLVSLIGAHAGGEVCVCDLAAGFDLAQPTISHHLKVLRKAGVIDCERRGTWVYYWLIPDVLNGLSELFAVPHHRSPEGLPLS